MADIILAEYRGQAWVVGGEQHIHDLLANTLPSNVTVELVSCESDSDVNALWAQHGGAPAASSSPCFIHPAIVSRIRRASSPHAVFFGQWSAMLDDEARTVIRSAANWAGEHAGSEVTLVRYVGTAPAPGVAELAELRAGLVASELSKLGVEASRVGRETRDVATVPGMPEESQRIDIVIKVA